jgi:hypothetical protein
VGEIDGTKISSPNKMLSEKSESVARQADEEVAGEVHNVSHLTRQVLWKLDIR